LVLLLEIVSPITTMTIPRMAWDVNEAPSTSLRWDPSFVGPWIRSAISMIAIVSSEYTINKLPRNSRHILMTTQLSVEVFSPHCDSGYAINHCGTSRTDIPHTIRIPLIKQEPKVPILLVVLILVLPWNNAYEKSVTNCLCLEHYKNGMFLNVGTPRSGGVGYRKSLIWYPIPNLIDSRIILGHQDDHEF
jgi:hypothetical protein